MTKILLATALLLSAPFAFATSPHEFCQAKLELSVDLDDARVNGRAVEAEVEYIFAFNSSVGREEPVDRIALRQHPLSAGRSRYTGTLEREIHSSLYERSLRWVSIRVRILDEEVGEPLIVVPVNTREADRASQLVCASLAD